MKIIPIGEFEIRNILIHILFSFWLTIHVLVEQEILTLPEYLRSPNEKRKLYNYFNMMRSTIDLPVCVYFGCQSKKSLKIPEG
jgi:hypothetical protein